MFCFFGCFSVKENCKNERADMIELHSQTATHIMEDLYLPHEPDDCLRGMLEDIRGTLVV